MLGRLIKHEIKATSRILIPAFIVWLAIIGLTKISLMVSTGDNWFLMPIAEVMLVMSNVVIFIIMLVIIVSRFYKNMLGDEGYLTFTLPVKTESIVFSKLITATIWQIVLTVFVFSSIFILLDSNDIAYLASEILPHFTFLNTQFFIMLGVYIVICSVFEVMVIYTAIAIASLFNKYRLLLSFAFYLVLEMAIQILNFIWGFILGFFSIMSNIENQIEISEEMTEVQVFEFLNKIFSITFSPISVLSLIGFMFIISVVLFIVTSRIFKKHLNLQ